VRSLRCWRARRKVIEVGLTIASVAYGGMLGVFLLGVSRAGLRSAGP